MTHYRLTLTKGRGPKMKMIAERHSYSKTPPSGWWRSVQRIGSTIHVRVCWTPDEACDALNGRESGAAKAQSLRSPESTRAAANPVQALTKPGGAP